MRRNIQSKAALGAVLGAAMVAVAACGGEPVAVLTAVPASATASNEAYTQFVVAQAPDDQREPLDATGVVPPTSETIEPAPVAR